jgi:hypothetical protein
VVVLDLVRFGLGFLAKLFKALHQLAVILFQIGKG